VGYRGHRTLAAVTDLLLSWLILASVTVAWHEYAHYNVLRLLNGTGYCIFYIFSGFVVVTQPPEGVLRLFLLGLSGGIGCSLLFLAILRLWIEEPADRWVRIPCVFYLWNQLVYGVGEALWVARLISGYWFMWAIAASFLAPILPTAITMADVMEYELGCHS